MELKISELTPSQIKAVWESEQFCMLTDRQLAALHHRQQYLIALEQWRERMRKLERQTHRFLNVCIVVVPLVLPLTFAGALFGLSAISCDPETGRFCRN